MIRKLQHRFVISAAVAVIIVLGTVIAIINFVMWGTLYYQTSQALDNLLIWQAQALTPEDGYWRPGAGLMLGNHYFLAWKDLDDGTITVDISHEVMVNEEEATRLAEEVISQESEGGVVFLNEEEFSWKTREIEEQDTVLAAFINTTATHSTIRALLMFSILIGILSWAGFLLIFIALSKRAIEPVVRNMESQKRFITNASHELKTPIAIISANTELLEALNGENEWTRNTLEQTERLTGLINELVTLTKVSEMENPVFTEIDFSGIVSDSCTAIQPVVDRQGKTLETKIEEQVMVTGDNRFLQMLANIFLDNAAKYCDDGGLIRVELKSRSRETGAVFRISNDYAAGKDVDYTRFFERFYQADESHNSKKGGFGIGLSTAQEIVNIHKGSIKTEYAHGRITFKITLPGIRKNKK